MLRKFFTAICLLTMLAVVGCGDPKKTDNKTDKTDKTGKTDAEAKTDDDKTADKTADKTEAEKTEAKKTEPGDKEPMKVSVDPMPIPDLKGPDDPKPVNQESGTVEKKDGLKLDDE